MDSIGCSPLLLVHDLSIAAAKVIKGGKTVRKVDVNEILEGLEEQIKEPAVAWACGDQGRLVGEQDSEMQLNLGRFPIPLN